MRASVSIAIWIAAGNLLAHLVLIGGTCIAAPQQAGSVEGVWGDHAGGNVYQIQGTTLRSFELTERTCVLGFVARREPTSSQDEGISFVAPRANFSVRPGMDDDHKVMAVPGQAVVQTLTRLPELPSGCTSPTRDTPLGNFEVFTQTFAERYAGLESRGVDWPGIVTSAKSKLNETTTRTELFDLLEHLLEPLHDLHTSVWAPELKRSSREFWRVGPANVMTSGSRALNAEGIARLFRITTDAYPRMVLRSFCQGQVLYGHVDREIGYIRILSFDGYSKDKDNVGALNGTLDTIFSDRTLRGLIIDLRVNLGGDDSLGLAVASRLTQHSYPAYRTEKRMPGDKWETSETLAVGAAAAQRFTGPVAELIGPLTMSAGEIFALALMGRTPRVTTVGEDTQGLLGGVLGRHLPNGWVFGLPNSRIVAPDGRSFEGKGLSPEIHIPGYSGDHSLRSGDPPLAMALEVVRRQFR